MKPCLHFVGFKDDRYWNAVKVFGRPDFIHRIWDVRALREIAAGDTIIFAEPPNAPSAKNGADISEWRVVTDVSWDDSNEDITARSARRRRK